MLELLSLATLAFAWLVPNHYPPWTSFYNELCAGIALFLLALAVGRSWRSERLPVMFWVVCAVAAIPPLQWLTGRLAYSGDAWVSAFYVLGFASAIAVGHLRSVADPAFAQALSATLLTGAVLSGGIAIDQGLETFQFGGALWVVEVSPIVRPGANLGQPNLLASLIGIGAIGLWLLHETGRLGRLTCSVLLLLLLSAIAVTQSRTALLFGPVVLSGIVVLRRRVPMRTPWYAVALVSAAQFLLMWLWPKLQGLLLLINTNPLGSRGLSSNRFQVWPQLVEAVNQSPWSGYGWLQVGEAQLSRAEPGVQFNELWLHGHNLFLELLIWCGYPLGLLLCFLIAGWAVSRTLAVRTSSGAAGVLTLGVLGVHSMIELPHHYLYLLVPAGLWIGMIERSAAGRRSFPAWWGAPVVAATAALGMAIAWDYRDVEEDFRLFRFEKTRIGDLRATELAPDAPMLSSLTAYVRAQRLPIGPAMTSDALAELERSMRRYPYPGAISNYASALVLTGRVDEARRVFATIRSIYGDKSYNNQRKVMREQGELEHLPALLAFEASLPDLPLRP